MIYGSGAGARARFAAVSLIHRLKASLNRHVHYDENHPGFRASRALSGAQIRSRRIGHCCIIGGVLEPVEEADDRPRAVRFGAAAELTPEALATITDQVRTRVLRGFARGGLIERDDVREMLALRAPPNRTAVSCSTPRCAAHGRAGSRRPLFRTGSGCCAIVPAQPSRWSVWNCLTPTMSSTACPNHKVTAPRRSPHWS